jgi:hypothetical protein
VCLIISGQNQKDEFGKLVSHVLIALGGPR